MKSLELERCTEFRTRATIFLACGFGLGLSPVASGTFGTLPGILVAIAVSNVLSALPTPLMTAAYAVVSLLLCLAAVPLCDAAENHFGTKDDGRIVADEYLTFPLCVTGLPLSAGMLTIAFLVNRIMDIAKPPPARQLQSIHGGRGIVVDDVISCLYALALNHVIYRLFLPYFQSPPS